MGSGLAGLVHSLDLGQCVPDAYAAYGPLIADGLAYFLDRLPIPHAAEVLAAQADLPATATPFERLTLLLRACPTLHKLGQVVARDRRLAPDLRLHLQQLEMLPAEMNEAVWRALPCDPSVRIAPAPLAEASVAVVVPFTWTPAGRPAEEGVFKVLKPGVALRLEDELRVWPDLADHLEERAAAYGLAASPFRETMDRVRVLLSSEIQLTHEQSHLEDARQIYRDDARILVPRLLPFCGPEVTAMERVRGRKVTADCSPGERRRTAHTLFDAVLMRPLFSEHASGLFHADPHAGNIFLTAEGRIALLDWSLVGRLGRAEREAVVQLGLAALALDVPGAMRAVRALARRVDERLASGIVADAIAELRQGRLPGFDWGVALMDRLAISGAGQFSEDLLFFRKAALSLSGVLADVDSEYSLDAGLFTGAAEAFASDLPIRLSMPVDSRDFRLRASAMDVAVLAFSAPLAAAQVWTTSWQRLLDRAVRAV